MGAEGAGVVEAAAAAAAEAGRGGGSEEGQKGDEEGGPFPLACLAAALALAAFMTSGLAGVGGGRGRHDSRRRSEISRREKMDLALDLSASPSEI